MNILRIALYNIKRYFKSPQIILFNIFIPIIYVSLYSFNLDIFISDIPIAVVNLEENFIDSTAMQKELKHISLKFVNEDEGITLLKNNKIAALYIFDTNFVSDLNNGIRSNITSYKNYDNNILNKFETYLENYISNKLKNKYISKDLINLVETNYSISNDFNLTESIFIILLLGYFMLCSISFISADLYKLKKAKVIYRMLFSANKDYEILIGISLSIFILEGMSYSASLCLMNFLTNIKINLALSIIYIWALAFISTTLTLLVVRLCSNENFINIILMILSIIFLFCGFMGPTYPGKPMNIPEIAIFFCKFSPLYWIFDGIFNNILFPNIIILIFMGLSILTAGKYSIKNFISSYN